jgi:protein-tyrosine phosphatase
VHSILFVCLGNICRSPMAEGAARAAFAAAGLAVELDSAGTGDWHIGRAPDPRAQATALAHGVDISGLAARQIAEEDFERFDLILAADHENLADLHAIAPPGGKARVALMLDMVPGRAGEAVADPYYGDANGFSRTWQDMSLVAAALVDATRAAAKR